MGNWKRVEAHAQREYGWDVKHILTVLSWRRLRIMFSNDFVLTKPEDREYDSLDRSRFAEPNSDDIWAQMDEVIGRETPKNVRRMSLAEFQKSMD